MASTNKCEKATKILRKGSTRAPMKSLKFSVHIWLLMSLVDFQTLRTSSFDQLSWYKVKASNKKTIGNEAATYTGFGVIINRCGTNPSTRIYGMPSYVLLNAQGTAWVVVWDAVDALESSIEFRRWMQLSGSKSSMKEWSKNTVLKFVPLHCISW